MRSRHYQNLRIPANMPKYACVWPISWNDEQNQTDRTNWSKNKRMFVIAFPGITFHMPNFMKPFLFSPFSRLLLSFSLSFSNVFFFGRGRDRSAIAVTRILNTRITTHSAVVLMLPCISMEVVFATCIYFIQLRSKDVCHSIVCEVEVQVNWMHLLFIGRSGSHKFHKSHMKDTDADGEDFR